MKVSEQIIQDTLISAFEGGIGYWACIVGYENEKPKQETPEYLPRYITTALSEDGAVKLEVDEGDGTSIHSLTREKILKAIDIMQVKHPRDFANMISENGDADTGDVMVQLALFGELVYS